MSQSARSSACTTPGVKATVEREINEEIIRHFSEKRAAAIEKEKTTHAVFCKLRHVASIGYTVLELSVKPLVQVELSDLKEKRRKYSTSEKQKIVELQLADTTSVQEVRKELKRKPSYHGPSPGSKAWGLHTLVTVALPCAH